MRFGTPSTTTSWPLSTPAGGGSGAQVLTRLGAAAVSCPPLLQLPPTACVTAGWGRPAGRVYRRVYHVRYPEVPDVLRAAAVESPLATIALEGARMPDIGDLVV